MPCSSSLGRIYGSTFQLSGIYQPTKEDKERYRFEGKHSTNLLCVKAYWECIAGIDGRWFVHCWVTDQAKVGHDQYTTYPMDHIHFWSILAFGPFWNNQRLKRQKKFLHQLDIPSNLQFHICKDQGLWQIQVDYHFSYSSRPIVKLGLIFIEKLGAHSYKKKPCLQYNQIRTIYPYSLLDLLILSWIDFQLKSGVGGYPLVLYETGLSSGTVPTLLPKEAKEQSTNKSLSF